MSTGLDLLNFISGYTLLLAVKSVTPLKQYLKRLCDHQEITVKNKKRQHQPLSHKFYSHPKLLPAIMTDVKVKSMWRVGL